MSIQEQTKNENHQPTAGSPILSPTIGLERPVDFPFSRLRDITWFEGRSWTDVFKLLIDSYRLRASMDRALGTEPRFVYKSKDKSNVAEGLCHFLRQAEQVPALLPQGWDSVLAGRCEVLARYSNDTSDWYSLDYLPNKREIARQYQDSSFPGQLQIFARLVYGTDVRGQDTDSLWTKMIRREDIVKAKNERHFSG